MRSSASPMAVSIRIGTVLSRRSDSVNSSPVSPGIITSTTSRSKSRPARRARAALALSAVVTRKPFSPR